MEYFWTVHWASSPFKNSVYTNAKIDQPCPCISHAHLPHHDKKLLCAKKRRLRYGPLGVTTLWPYSSSDLLPSNKCFTSFWIECYLWLSYYWVSLRISSKLPSLMNALKGLTSGCSLLAQWSSSVLYPVRPSPPPPGKRYKLYSHWYSII